MTKRAALNVWRLQGVLFQFSINSSPLPSKCTMASFGKFIWGIIISLTSSKYYRQLLYYPFNAFFVIFANIIHAPLSEICDHDLRLLRSTVDYYTEMSRGENVLAGKMENIAHVFASLAELYMYDARTRHSITTTDSLSSSVGSYLGEEDPGSSNLNASTETSFPTFQSDVFMNTDLLSCFMAPDYMPPPFHSHEQLHSEPSEDGSYMSCQSGVPPDPVIASQSEVFGWLDNWSTGNKRPLACTFDWFSWDQNNIESPDVERPTGKQRR
jgi:hypothetical protein